MIAVLFIFQGLLLEPMYEASKISTVKSVSDSVAAMIEAGAEVSDETLFAMQMQNDTCVRIIDPDEPEEIFQPPGMNAGCLLYRMNPQEIEGMISAIKYARENNIPYLGLCLGMQLGIVEFARHVIGWNDAHSAELDPATTHPVIHLMPDQNGVEDIGGTLRLGSYPCVLAEGTKARELYGKETISERHRHRYEVNNYYRDDLEKHGMKLSGLSPDNRIVEMMEIPSHPWYVATQAHPEFKSRPNHPHPLFKGFIGAAIKYQDK